MNSVLFLKELWRRRLLVVLAVLVSAGAAFLVMSKDTSKVEAEGSIQVLVDSANSPIANARFDLSGLIARAGVFARLMSGGNVIRQIADDTGIPVKKIDVAGPLPLPGEAPGVSEAPAYVNPYRIEITQQTELPILTVVTRAPTVAEARALAAAAPRAISREVAQIQVQQETPEGKRVEFRVLGPAQARLFDDSTSKKIAAGVFVVLLILFLALIVGLPRFAAAWRAADAEPKAAEGAAGDGDRDDAPPAAGAAAPDGSAPRKRTRKIRGKGKRSRGKSKAKEPKPKEPGSKPHDAPAAEPAAGREHGPAEAPKPDLIDMPEQADAPELPDRPEQPSQPELLPVLAAAVEKLPSKSDSNGSSENGARDESRAPPRAMEPARTLKILWRRRRLVVVGAVIALAAAIISVFTVSVFPPQLTTRTNVFATASSQILVDTPDSSFADLSYELEPLETRAGVFARFLANPAALELISRQADIPAGEIEAQGPYEQNIPLNQQEPTAEERSTQIIGEGALYRLRFENNPDLPIISVFAQAPTEKEAKALAAAAPAALRIYVERLQERQQTPRRDRVEIRPLGHATGGVVNAGANTEIAILIFFVVFVGWCVLLVPAHTIARGWREESGGGGGEHVGGGGGDGASNNGHGRREDAIRAGLPERTR